MSASSRRVIFVGPGGAGKTTLGKQVAATLGFPFYDLDDMFCDQILNIRSFIGQNGYEAYSHRNGLLLAGFLEQAPSRMVAALSSGVLSKDMAEPLRGCLVTLVRNSGDAFLVLPHPDDERAAEIVARRQVRRGFGLLYEPERQKYLRRLTEYRALGFPELVVSDADRIAIKPPKDG
ncbi:shikimate kinase [Falsirhodobacter deserti]|uniref:shikimate kinase n=1 Tax=Falsirhodobacter deserti TaxID=1365611 RepID=UPI000FE38B10|nr:shikimate kinase [Falsirhodobacter deserti]